MTDRRDVKNPGSRPPHVVYDYQPPAVRYVLVEIRDGDVASPDLWADAILDDLVALWADRAHVPPEFRTADVTDLVRPSATGATVKPWLLRSHLHGPRRQD